MEYDKIWKFHNKYAPVQIKDKEGFIDKQGNEICPIKYNWVNDFENGFAIVSLNNKYGFIDTNGKEICPIKYDYEKVINLNPKLLDKKYKVKLLLD